MEDIVFDRVEWKSRSTRKLPCFPQKKKKERRRREEKKASKNERSPQNKKYDNDETGGGGRSISELCDMDVVMGIPFTNRDIVLHSFMILTSNISLCYYFFFFMK